MKSHRVRLSILHLGIVLLLWAPTRGSEPTQPSPGETAFNAVKHDRTRLHDFLRGLPKGGVLHAHLSGELNPDLVLDLAAQNNYFVRVDGNDLGHIGVPRDVTYKLIAPATYKGLDTAGQSHFRPLADYLKENPDGHKTLHSSLTYQPDEPPSEFFGAIFDRLEEPGKAPEFQDAYFRDIIERAHRDGINYLELRVNPVLVLRSGQIERWGDLVDKCNSEWPEEEAVTARFIIGVHRGRATTESELAAAFQAAAADDKDRDLVVGVDLVDLENAANAPARYLSTFRELELKYPSVPITLHAGESNERDTHVRDAILMGARRIGHGTNIALDQPDTLRLAKDNGVLIEVSLLSNRLMLRKPIGDHPFWTYLNCGVPVCLNTDDGGVFDTTMTDEFTEAVLAFDLSWEQVRTLCENSLKHSFARDQDRDAVVKHWTSRWRNFENKPPQ